MKPIYGRAFGQERAILSSPFRRTKNMTIIGAIDYKDVVSAMYGQWSANGEIFLQFIENQLCPKLKPHHVVVMDNVKFHQVKGVRELIEETGAMLIYLPPYHPELNPIENMCSKIKKLIAYFISKN